MHPPACRQQSPPISGHHLDLDRHERACPDIFDHAAQCNAAHIGTKVADAVSYGEAMVVDATYGLKSGWRNDFNALQPALRNVALEPLIGPSNDLTIWVALNAPAANQKQQARAPARRIWIVRRFGSTDRFFDCLFQLSGKLTECNILISGASADRPLNAGTGAQLIQCSARHRGAVAGRATGDETDTAGHCTKGAHASEVPLCVH